MIPVDQLKTVEKMVRTAIKSYRQDLRYEDAVQEALIHAWKDIQSGEYDFNHMTNRAKLWARSFLQKPYARTTGAPPLSRDGVTTEDAERKRQKITSYVHEFSKLHDRKPSNSEVAQALGIPLATVAQQRINIATGAYDHAIYEGEGKRRRIASAYFNPAHLDAVIDPDTSAWAADHGFENETVANLDFERLLSGLSTDSRNVIYYHVFMGYNKRETSQFIGITQRQLDTRLQRALDEVRAYYDVNFVLPPDTCPNGHEKTEENARYTSEGHRRCKPCIAAYEDKRRAKVKAERAAARAAKPQVLKTHCKRGHEIRGLRRGDGKRYCKVCNYMRSHDGNLPKDGSKIYEWDQPK